MNVAVRPSEINMIEKPVIKQSEWTMAFFLAAAFLPGSFMSLSDMPVIYAMNDGIIGKRHGERNVKMPALNATM